MSTPARRRLMRDFKRLQDDPPVGVSGAPTDNNILLWNAVIFGYVYHLIKQSRNNFNHHFIIIDHMTHHLKMEHLSLL